ncbi:hypothetical protein [Elioraea sp.]|uniref:hypothetical protein n=1 Tax=Elioraea sp. TaxID=2185103 RepID=UPI0025BA362C|nr:hypothetical protein [Elioraea sp.]
MTQTITSRADRQPRQRKVVLRASRSRLLLDRVIDALPARTVTALNAFAFVSLAAALLILLLV